MVRWEAREGVQDVVIAFAVVLKISLVGAGGDQALISKREHPQQVPGIHGALDADGEGRAPRLLADQQDVPPQVDDPAVDAPAEEQRLDLIRDIPLGQGPQVHPHAGAGQVRGAVGFIQNEIVHAQQALGGGQLLCGRIVAPVSNIPQIDERPHGHVQIPAGALVYVLGKDQ